MTYFFFFFTRVTALADRLKARSALIPKTSFTPLLSGQVEMKSMNWLSLLRSAGISTGEASQGFTGGEKSSSPVAALGAAHNYTVSMIIMTTFNCSDKRSYLPGRYIHLPPLKPCTDRTDLAGSRALASPLLRWARLWHSWTWRQKCLPNLPMRAENLFLASLELLFQSNGGQRLVHLGKIKGSSTVARVPVHLTREKMYTRIYCDISEKITTWSFSRIQTYPPRRGTGTRWVEACCRGWRRRACLVLLHPGIRPEKSSTPRCTSCCRGQEQSIVSYTNEGIENMCAVTGASPNLATSNLPDYLLRPRSGKPK